MRYIRQVYYRFRLFFSSNYPKGYGLCERHKAIIKYGFSGCLAAAVGLVFLYIFHDLFGWGIVVSTTAAFLVSFLVSFSLQKYWTFRDKSQDRIAGQLITYLVNGLIGLQVNAYSMHVLVEIYGIWYLGAQVLVNLIIAVQNFLVYKFIVFNKKRHEVLSPQKKIE